MDFITLDFETANNNIASPCEIGITFVESNKIVETKSWLIRPRGNYFNYYNTKIHGITASDVAESPEFDELWGEIKPLIEDQFVLAHNASFDMGVLQKTLQLYDLAVPNLLYGCTVQLARKLWPGRAKYDLKSLCDWNEIEFRHHRAGADSEATALMILKGFEQRGIVKFDDVYEQIGYKAKRISSTPTQNKKSYAQSMRLFSKKEEYPNLRDSFVFFQKNVVFTGMLETFNRRNAEMLIVELGGNIQSEVSFETNFLILGAPNPRYSLEHKSKKYLDALEYKERGADIQILTEAEFKKMLSF